MATKKRIEQLEKLLDWEREGGRLPKTTELFNRMVAPTLALRELTPKVWTVEMIVEGDDDNFKRFSLQLKHVTLIQLGLTILDAVELAEKRR